MASEVSVQGHLALVAHHGGGVAVEAFPPHGDQEAKRGTGRGLGSQYLLQEHIPGDLTSFQ